MAEPFVSEIKMFGFDFAPPGWAFCDGQQMPITSNQTLYALIGDTYGGDLRTWFGLPDMRGRVPVHKGYGAGQIISQGEMGGLEQVALSKEQIPAHTHEVNATKALGTEKQFTEHILAAGSDAKTSTSNVYGPADKLVPLNSASVGVSGGSNLHNNMQPSSVVNFCIATIGAFPSRN